MTPEKKITLNGQEVSMIYCTATENGYERLAEKSINVFFPTFGKDEEGNDIITEPATAKTEDFIVLAIAAIVAYYSRAKKDVPVDSDYILYDATPQERTDLLTAIIELRTEWYTVPKVVEETIRKESEGKDGNPKNA
jgi:hypothetical protein